MWTGRAARRPWQSSRIQRLAQKPGLPRICPLSLMSGLSIHLCLLYPKYTGTHTSRMKKLLRVHRQPEGHWVGDGFPVHTVLDYGRHPELSPFLLLDHAGPADFAPADKPRGVGWHPHRGFETVTLVLAGEVDHEDTAGNGGRIGPGEVQWMTAGSGLLHKEMHSPEFTRRGGKFHALQLWVNLPAKSKMSAPRYQTLVNDQIPVVDGVRVLAGQYQGTKGPAETFTPVNLFDVRLRAGQKLRLNLRD